MAHAGGDMRSESSTEPPRISSLDFGCLWQQELVAAAAEKRPEKKRKASYLKVKEEREALQREAQQLESQVAVLKVGSMPPEGAAKAEPSVQRTAIENAALTSILQRQQLHLANAQSLLSRCQGELETHPLYTRICLTKNWDERRDTLRAIRSDKLRNAYEYLMARGSYVSLLKPQCSDERFESERGDLCCTRYETVHFPGVESLEQVFDALVFFLTNLEIIISERLGHVTLRDDYDCVEGRAYNSRIASAEDFGVTTEVNGVSFPHLFKAGELGVGSEACAVIATDCVDEDELYPYKSKERMRKDICGAVLLTASRSKPAKGGHSKLESSSGVSSAEGGELVVTMRRAAFLKLHRPEFPVSAFALQELHEGIAGWGDVMVKTIRSIVYARP